MRFSQSIDTVSEVAPDTAFRFASESIPREWIDESLRKAGVATIRKRKLPAESVIPLVIAMALFRDRSIPAVVSHLGLARDPDDLSGRSASVVPASIAEARARVGDKPLEHLFNLTATHWAFEAANRDRWLGLSVFALDGSTASVADTPENERYFGRSKSGRGQSAYPKVKFMALNVPRAHLLAALAIGPYATSEIVLAHDLWARVPDYSVTLVDRGLIAYGTFYRLREGGKERHWLTRAKKNLRWRVVKRLGPGDHLVEVEISPESRKKDPTLPKTMRLRAVRYRRKGFKPQVLLTSLLDAERYSAAQVIELYHERWEIELGFDEKKTHMLERKESLRSKTPTGVLQELWGVAIAYNVVRLIMAHVAQDIGVPPRRISFWNSLLLIRNFALGAWHDAPGTLPKLFAEMKRQMHLLVLPERRPRSNPREVKVKMSKFRKKPLRKTRSPRKVAAK
jgi:Insertion element 4 transposase N-terminal/Transposase DDE domain